MSRRNNNTQKEDNDDEAMLLASLSATIQDQDVYEDKVIKEATLSKVPQLFDIDDNSQPASFPALQELAPGGQQNVPHFFSALTQIRRQQQKGSHQDEILYIQEQMILQYLQNVAGISDLPLRDEAKREKERSQSLQQSQMESCAERPSPGPSITRKRKKRVPIMKRKNVEFSNNVLEKEERISEEDKAKLREVRESRKKKRAERQKLALLSDSSPSSSEEEEFGEETDATGAKAAKSSKDGLVASDDDMETDAVDSISCPLCSERLSVQSGCDRDELLAKHIQSCQTNHRPRRQTRTAVMAKDVRPKNIKTKRKRRRTEVMPHFSSSKDDLQEWVYMDRVDDWIENGIGQMKDMAQLRDITDQPPGAETLAGGLYIPAWINDHLFGYQREGLQWMWDLHRQQAGGCIGDEMGLGKTVQVCSFLGVLAASRKIRSVLIVSPATMLQHWLNELSVWAPGLRRILLHPSGEADGFSRNLSPELLRALGKWLRRSRKDRINEAIDERDWDEMAHHSFCGSGYAVVTTYENLRRNADIYTSHEWSYVVLDEAQKIRNPDADVTLAVKRIRTPHRLAMSGTPIQNDLRELWSLFDFVFPGRLGTLPAFEQEFADPIKRGGYSNASPMQVQLAYRCSLTLRDLVSPFLLRRLKKDVKEVNRMPSKTEHVLFCRLTDRQRDMYASFIRSDDVIRVLQGSSNLLAAVTVLRKICNHPDLICPPDQASLRSFLKHGPAFESIPDDSEEFMDEELGDEESLMERSGKLQVLSKILPLWHKQGHRVLLFCQWKKMLDIIQRFMLLKGWKFARLDGDTNVGARQRLVDQFNDDDTYFCLLCTTRTGGVGLNLTGANRIILYDPDWNPSTDSQARERAWRFGQEKEVTIYRLITAGTVEEKIYQRQIFKTALSNKILQDPRQRRLFSQKDLHDLFSLTADGGSIRAGGDGITDTSKVTKGVGVVDFEQDVGKSNNDDNDETLRKVMKSRGLAGVFDHHYLEQDTSRKSTTVREMEEQAKKVAREAAKALEKSIPSHDRFAPTWTGSKETESRFGNASIGRQVSVRTTSGIQQATASSRSIIANLRQRDQEAQSDGPAMGEQSQQYAELLVRVKNFVRRRSPTTDEILKEFESVPNCDVAIFRRLLKSVASMEAGKWYLK